VNLLRSAVVLGDRDGELVMPIVKNGRPGTAMAAIPMPDADIMAVVAYIHSLQAQGDIQGGPPPGPPVVLNILVGDAKAGAAYFGTTCASCHSATGDLAGLAGRVPDAKALQNLWVSGGRASGHGPGQRPRRAENAASVKLTLPDEVVQGRLVRLDDFLVIVLLDDGSTRTIRRNGDSPTVVVLIRWPGTTSCWRSTPTRTSTTSPLTWRPSNDRHTESRKNTHKRNVSRAGETRKDTDTGNRGRGMDTEQ